MLLTLNMLTQLLEAGFVKTLPLFRELHDAKKTSQSVTETKFSYFRLLVNNEVCTLLGNNANFFFAYGNRKLLFLPFKVGCLSQKLAAKTALSRHWLFYFHIIIK